MVDIMTSERLKGIIDVLSKYHQRMIEENTLKSQDPEATLDYLRTALSKDGDVLEDYLQWRRIPSTELHRALKECIKELSKFVDPPDLHVSTLGPEWCRIMFKDHALTISPDHIQRLYKNSGYVDE
jgi:hypothetical protein